MLELAFRGVCVLVVIWAFYRVLLRLVVKTALDNIPGPPSPSFFKGACTLNSNNALDTLLVR